MSGVEATEPTESAVVVLVPAADPAVGPHRLELDPAAAWGVPAHVTVLYPFVDPDALDDLVLDVLAGAVATVPGFVSTFRRTATFDDGYLWLEPEPESAFRLLLSVVHAAFPSHPPYGGAEDDPVPHLTIGTAGPGRTRRLRAAAREIEAALPLTQVVSSVAVLVGARAAASWRVLREVPLGGRR